MLRCCAKQASQVNSASKAILKKATAEQARKQETYVRSDTEWCDGTGRCRQDRSAGHATPLCLGGGPDNQARGQSPPRLPLGNGAPLEDGHDAAFPSLPKGCAVGWQYHRR